MSDLLGGGRLEVVAGEARVDDLVEEDWRDEDANHLDGEDERVPLGNLDRHVVGKGGVAHADAGLVVESHLLREAALAAEHLRQVAQPVGHRGDRKAPEEEGHREEDGLGAVCAVVAELVGEAGAKVRVEVPANFIVRPKVDGRLRVLDHVDVGDDAVRVAERVAEVGASVGGEDGGGDNLAAGEHARRGINERRIDALRARYPELHMRAICRHVPFAALQNLALAGHVIGVNVAVVHGPLQHGALEGVLDVVAPRKVLPQHLLLDVLGNRVA